MTLAADSVLVTPGSGETIATHAVSSKEHQVVMAADVDGHIVGSKPVYFFRIADQVHVAGANTIHWDLWNGDAALVVRVLSIKQMPNILTAVTGVVFDWSLIRTTSVGTGGTGQTAWLPELNQTALDADITCRSKPAGGAASGTTLFSYQVHSEETNAATQMLAMMMLGGVADLVPYPLRQNRRGIRLGPSEGLKCVQVTNSAAGNTGWLIGFTVE